MAVNVKRLLILLLTVTLSLSLSISAQSASVYSAVAVDDVKHLATGMPMSELAGEQIYFVMPDRYANGETSNDNGAGDSFGGFNKSDWGYFHGGDLKGLKENLDRIQNMGFTALWITPVMLQRAVQGSSAAYHGYWGMDFTEVDPHFGSKEDFKDLVDALHQRGMKIYLDIVINHTADIISFNDGYTYENISSKPYKDASGTTFSLASVAGKPLCNETLLTNCFPQLNLASFPKSINAGDSNLKWPAFLQDVKNYHNRGNISDWSNPEQSMYADFFGLDDLMTESPVVIEGLAEIWANWVIDYEIDGFRIDTAKHVDKDFFNSWVPKVYEKVSAKGVNVPEMFGEIATPDAESLSEFVRERGLQSVLDFFGASALISYIGGESAESMSSLFAYDDYYNVSVHPYGHVSNAYSLATFAGNHDFGRIASQIQNQLYGISMSNLAKKVNVAYSMMFLMRGAPIVYYGDEVGMIGGDGDKAARQDMFPTEVVTWQTEKRAGSSPIGTGSSLSIQSHPVMNNLKALGELRKNHPALATGIFQSNSSTIKMPKIQNSPCKTVGYSKILKKGKWYVQCLRIKKKKVWRVAVTNQVATWSRFDRQTWHEYVVLANPQDGTRTVTLKAFTPNAQFTGIFGTTSTVTSAGDGSISVTMPANSVFVLKGSVKAPSPTTNFNVTIEYQKEGLAIKPTVIAKTNQLRIPGIATFIYRASDQSPWQRLGVDDNNAYRFIIPSWVWGNSATMQVAVIMTSSDGTHFVSDALTISRN